MSKAQLRNALEKRFKDRADICVPELVYKQQRTRNLQCSVVLVDVLTRLHSITERKTSTVFNPDAEQNVVRDGASLVTSVARQFDWYFSRGARVVVYLVDKAPHVPVTKGVEQRRRTDDADADMHNIEHEDLELAQAAERRLLRRARIVPGMSDAQKKRSRAIMSKIEKYNRARADLEDTYQRLTILELDDLRGCWERLPVEKRHELLLQMRDHGMALRVRDASTGDLAPAIEHPGLLDSITRLDIELDDYQLESVLLAVVRRQSLPRPWDLMIRSTSSEHGARAKIVRYLVRSLIHGYYDAYTPQPGTRIYIDGHDMPGWRIAQSNVFTRIPAGTFSAPGEPAAAAPDDETATFLLHEERVNPETGARIVRDKRVRREYQNTSPLELKSPHDQTVYVVPAQSPDAPAGERDAATPDETAASSGHGTLRLHEPAVYANTAQHMRGNVPNAAQPRVRYAKEFANRIGEADMSVFTWVEKLRVRAREQPPAPGETAVRYDSFEIVSCDSDLFYYTLLYIHKLRRAGEPRIDITLVMDTGWRPTKRVFAMQPMYDAVVAEMLDGDADALLSLLVALYASAGDYVVGYKFVTPETFTTTYLKHRKFIGSLVRTTRCDASEPQWVLDGRAYRRLLHAAYFTARAKRYSSKLGTDDLEEIRDLAQLRELLNMLVIPQAKDRQYFGGKKPSRQLASVPQFEGGDIDASDDNEAVWLALEQYDYEMGLFVTRLQNKVPDDREITRRGLLLQYFLGMLNQLGASELQLPNPLDFGYALIDPDKPLARRNIHFDACYKYEMFQCLQRRVERHGMDALSPSDRRLYARCNIGAP
jgi:hypothetical protein